MMFHVSDVIQTGPHMVSKGEAFNRLLHTFPEIINDYKIILNPPKILAYCARKAESKN